jgi:hypothetical protein
MMMMMMMMMIADFDDTHVGCDFDGDCAGAGDHYDQIW